jgi:hypothetical protein
VPDNSGAVDLGAMTPDEQEAVNRLAAERGGEEPDKDERPKVLTAFAVVVGYDGNPTVTSYEHDDFLVQNNPTTDLVYGACQTVIKDIQSQETAQASAAFTVQAMQQQARAIAEAQQQAQIARSLKI